MNKIPIHSFVSIIYSTLIFTNLNTEAVKTNTFNVKKTLTM